MWQVCLAQGQWDAVLEFFESCGGVPTPETCPPLPPSFTTSNVPPPSECLKAVEAEATAEEALVRGGLPPVMDGHVGPAVPGNCGADASLADGEPTADGEGSPLTSQVATAALVAIGTVPLDIPEAHVSQENEETRDRTPLDTAPRCPEDAKAVLSGESLPAEPALLVGSQVLEAAPDSLLIPGAPGGVLISGASGGDDVSPAETVGEGARGSSWREAAPAPVQIPMPGKGAWGGRGESGLSADTEKDWGLLDGAADEGSCGLGNRREGLPRSRSSGNLERSESGVDGVVKFRWIRRGSHAIKTWAKRWVCPRLKIVLYSA
jgi:hypothetical protein